VSSEKGLPIHLSLPTIHSTMSDTNSKINRAVWMDIPVAELDRACTFYAAVLGCEVSQQTFGDFQLGVLEHEEGNGCCLVLQPEDISDKGTLVYYNTDGRIRDAVAKVVEHGGSVTKDVHAIGPHGFRAIVLDSGGNRIALHSNTDA